MSPTTCLTCRRLNPPTAAYCYFDGVPLNTATRGPRNVASEEFPTPFVFPSGRTCRSFEELGRACRQDWDEARGLLKDGSYRPFLVGLGRIDLVKAAEQAAEHPDPDLGLDEFLSRLPGSPSSPARMEVRQGDVDMGNLAVGQDRTFTLTIENTGERLLAGVVRGVNCVWLGVSEPNLNEKRFQVLAGEQLQLPLHVRGKQLRAAPQLQIGEVEIESNGGAGSIRVILRVPVTPFPDGVFKGARSPRQLAEKARNAPQEMARLLESGAVARWYQSNGWKCPVTRLSAKGLPAVRQYLKALGLTLPTTAEPRGDKGTKLPPLPGPGLPPLPDGAGPAPVPEIIPLEEPRAAPGGARILPMVAVGCAVLVGLLALGGVAAWVVIRDALQDSSKSPPVASATTAAKAPTTKKQAEPAKEPKKKPDAEPEKENPRLLALIEQLKAADPGTNREALKALPELDDSAARKAIPAVVGAALRNPDDDFRQLAGTELQRLGLPLPKDIDCLRDALRIPHRAMRRYVITALKDLGDRARSALPVVLDALKHDDPDVRSEAAAVMKGLGPTARAPALRLLMNPTSDAEETGNRGVLQALLGQSPALTGEETDVFVEVLGDRKRRTDLRCFALAQLGGGAHAVRAVPVLVQVLEERPDTKLLAPSIKALGRIGDKRPPVSAALLKVATSDREEAIRLESLQVLEQLDPSALPAARLLERWPAETGASVRLALGRLLGARLAALKPDQMTELLPVLRHKDPGLVLVGLKVVQDRKEDAVGVALEVSGLLKHEDAGVREAAAGALQAMGPTAAKAVPGLTRTVLELRAAERTPAVQEALGRLLGSRLASLKPEDMWELLPLLRHKDPGIVRVGLGVVKERMEEAAGVTDEVVRLLRHDDARVREAAAGALQALGAAAAKAQPGLAQLVLQHWADERDTAVREALAQLLGSRLAALKPDQMKELLPLLRHRDPDIVLVGLKVVLERKGETAAVADEVARLLRSDNAKVRDTATAALVALGPAAAKALPTLFEVLDDKPKYRRTSLALLFAGIVDPRDEPNVARLLTYLLEGLHPEALRMADKDSEATILALLIKLKQPAVDAIFRTLNPDSRGKDEINYRKTLYNVLAELGPTCRSQANFDTLRGLQKREVQKKYKDVIEAAGKALAAMSP